MRDAAIAPAPATRHHVARTSFEVSMRYPAARPTILAFALMLLGTRAGAQQAAPAPTYPAPDTGTLAPDFALPGATRYGLLRDPVRLSDYRGKTVVLAFFYRARTKG
jgi:peroxiredoxin Q/BCP